MYKIIGYVKTNNLYKDTDEQRDLIMSYANENGKNVELFEDINVSGLVIGEQLKAAIKKASPGDIFVVKEASRISRDFKNFQKVINTLDGKSVNIVYLT